MKRFKEANMNSKYYFGDRGYLASIVATHQSFFLHVLHLPFHRFSATPVAGGWETLGQAQGSEWSCAICERRINNFSNDVRLYLQSRFTSCSHIHILLVNDAVCFPKVELRHGGFVTMFSLSSCVL